jgi:hypothetical protein
VLGVKAKPPNAALRGLDPCARIRPQVRMSFDAVNWRVAPDYGVEAHAG